MAQDSGPKSKLEGYGFEGKLQEWFRDFLIERRQRVGVVGSFSEWTQALSGIPQGLVLRPVLFICYMNDLPKDTASFIFLYTDDASLQEGRI